MDGIKDHYSVLGVPDDAETSVIRDAYRATMRKYHPDLNSSGYAAARARAVNEAYRILRDPASRARYDGIRSHFKRLTQGRYPGSFPGVLDRGDRRQKQIALDRELGSRHSWMPFLAFVFVSAASLAAAINSGTLDPKGNPAFITNSVTSEREPSKRIDDLIAKFVDNDATLQGSVGPTGNNGNRILSRRDDYFEPLALPLLKDIAEGAKEFANISLKSGIIGAKKFSLKCHRGVELSPSWRDADRCAAFDYTAAYVDEDVARTTHSAPDDYFTNQRKVQEQNYGTLGMPVYAAAVRLAEIQKAVRPIVDANQLPSSNR